jgi:hypothetical protein
MGWAMVSKLKIWGCVVGFSVADWQQAVDEYSVHHYQIKDGRRDLTQKN